MKELQAAIEEIARKAASETVEHLEQRVRFLEARLADRKTELLTEKEAAALLSVSLKTLFNWRQGKPVIPFVRYEGGGIRYERAAIDNYLSRRKAA